MIPLMISKKNICNGHPLHVGGSDDVMLGDLVGDAQGSTPYSGGRKMYDVHKCRPIYVC